MYFEESAKSEPRLLPECIYTYIKANQPEKTKELLEICSNRHEMEIGIRHFISYLHSMEMASAFCDIEDAE